MKTFIIGLFFFGICKVMMAQCDPPQISPRASLVAYGESITLETLGCNGTVNWSNGMTGNSITFMVNDATAIYATCTDGGCTSSNSEPAGIGINWSYSDCNEIENVNTIADKTFQKTQASVEVNGSASIEDSSTVVYDATQRINLEAGFETKSGAVFKTELTGCKELNTSTGINGLNRPWEILWGEDDHIWFTERIGKVGRVNPVTGIRDLDFTIADCSQFGEGGLLGMALDPNFSTNNYLYVVYCYFLAGQAQTNDNYRERLVNVSSI